MAEMVESIGDISPIGIGRLLQKFYGDKVSARQFGEEIVFFLTPSDQPMSVQVTDAWIIFSHQINIGDFEGFQSEYNIEKVKDYLTTKVAWVRLALTDDNDILVKGYMVLRTGSSSDSLFHNVVVFSVIAGFLHKEIKNLQNS